MPVYKDECMYSFDNQESPYGIDVCLACFIGTSPHPDHNFTAYHHRVTGHSAYLNIRKIAKPEASKNENDNSLEHQPKKLAIAESSDADQFDIKSEFKTLSDDKEAEYQQAIDKVLAADSYNKVQETEAWELELQPCEHVAILESTFDSKPATTISAEVLSHCSQCELDKNLWICLECGSLGCGRRHFDGSGGNGHALTHFAEQGHPLAVKLGSITPEGHADVYCYACDDDTKDPQIRKHLAHWGIDIAQHVKTEKSMTELQLEQNMNWDFSSGTDGEPVSGGGFTGLKNLGNSCYMNSVLQSLFGIPEFAAHFHPNDPNSSEIVDPESLTTQMNKLKDGLLSGRYDVVAPQMLKYLIGKDHAEFATARQQDAFEYLSYLLTKISQKVDRNLPGELFGFQTERRIACRACSAVRYVSENEESISVAVPIEEVGENSFRPVEVNELLDIFTQEEELESKCPLCESNTAISSLKFKTFPKVLILNARRFRLINWVPQKVDVPVVVPTSPLNMEKYLSKGPQPDENVVSDTDAANTDTFTADPVKVEMLQSMGFEKEQCVQALKLAKERGFGDGDFEAAVELIFSGEAQAAAASAPESKRKSAANIDPESKASLEAMGFSAEQAAAALEQNNSNVEAAVEWLFTGNYETYMATAQSSTSESAGPAQSLGDSSLPALYKLNSVVCHKGASVHVGHYITARRDENAMYLYNDERVTKGIDTNEVASFAYIYLFQRV